MNTIAIALSDERLLKLQKLANGLNVSIEELVLIGIENLLARLRKAKRLSQTCGKLGKSDRTFGK
jgi:hypothetical protein